MIFDGVTTYFLPRGLSVFESSVELSGYNGLEPKGTRAHRFTLH